MRRPMSRQRKTVVDDALVELFRAAIPAKQATWRDAVNRKRALTVEQHAAACDVMRAFHRAAGIAVFQHSPLSPNADDKALQAALLARMPEDEVKAFHAFWRRDAAQREKAMAPARGRSTGCLAARACLTGNRAPARQNTPSS